MLTGEKFHYILQGARHLDFSDSPLFSPFSDLILETGSIAAEKAVLITNAVALSFFDQYLKNNVNQIPENLTGYSELLMK
jgi:hypothetical protein